MTSQATVLKPDTQSQIQETKNKESDNIIKNFSNFSILSSFALYAQASYWKSMRRHSGQFCLHATGSLEEVVKSAIQKKFKILGLSEHVPRSRFEDLYPEEVSRYIMYV